MIDDKVCYKFLNAAADYENAKEICIQQGDDECQSSLLTVSSAEQVLNDQSAPIETLHFVNGR